MLPPTYINAKDVAVFKKLVRKNAQGRVLDVGCGSGEAREWLPRGSTYVGIDQKPGDCVNVVGDIHALPFAANSFDSAICGTVLEHAISPDKVLQEIHRVLKVGGKLVVTVPFLVHYHKDPDDYWRFTHVGLKEKLVNVGFDDITVHINYGVFAVVEYAFFSTLVHARREHFFTKYWHLLPYYLVIAFFFFFFKIINYSIGSLQKRDTSMYVGIAAVATKTQQQ